MPMSVETYRRNLQWIEDQKAIGYRLECRTKLEWPKPEDVDRILNDLPIVCAPLHKERVWLFETETQPETMGKRGVFESLSIPGFLRSSELCKKNFC